MPTTINGIGTQYYGRRSPRVYSGVCDSCHQHVTLTDYETGHFFVVIFIPLIPLGKKQVIGECSACRRHRVMPLQQWERLKEESIDTGLNALSENMHDPVKAIELLHNMTMFNQMEEAIDLAGATAKQHRNDFDAQIEIGSWYEQQGMKQESDQCFETAITIDPNHPTSLRIQGMDAIQNADPSKAAKCFSALKQSDEYYDPALFFLLATTFQQKGMHEQALAEFQDILQRVPEIGKDAAFRKSVKQSEKTLGIDESILPKKGLFG